MMDVVHGYKKSRSPMGVSSRIVIRTDIKRKWEAALEDLILQYTYPRIDAEVSKHRNHLLKAPFCVHPGTGRVCVPIDPAKVDKFDPDTVPTVGELLVELDRAPPSDSNGKMTEGELNSSLRKLTSDYERTSLKPYVDMLEKHARGVIADVKGVRQGELPRAKFC